MLFTFVLYSTLLWNGGINSKTTVKIIHQSTHHTSSFSNILKVSRPLVKVFENLASDRLNSYSPACCMLPISLFADRSGIVSGVFAVRLANLPKCRLWISIRSRPKGSGISSVKTSTDCPSKTRKVQVSISILPTQHETCSLSKGLKPHAFMTTNVFRVRHVAGGTLADRARTCSALCLTYLNAGWNVGTVSHIAEQSNSKIPPTKASLAHRISHNCKVLWT